MTRWPLLLLLLLAGCAGPTTRIVIVEEGGVECIHEAEDDYIIFCHLNAGHGKMIHELRFPPNLPVERE